MLQRRRAHGSFRHANFAIELLVLFETLFVIFRERSSGRSASDGSDRSTGDRANRPCDDPCRRTGDRTGQRARSHIFISRFGDASRFFGRVGSTWPARAQRLRVLTRSGIGRAGLSVRFHEPWICMARATEET